MKSFLFTNFLSIPQIEKESDWKVTSDYRTILAGKNRKINVSFCDTHTHTQTIKKEILSLIFFDYVHKIAWHM